jgi:hypothetical protein
MLKDYKVVLTNQFLKHFNNDKSAFTKGKNLLSYRMAQELTARFLKSERDFLSQQSEPVFIEALEQEYSKEIEIEVHGEKKKLLLRGFVDRIDRVGENVRIIDYKSGKVADEDVRFKSRVAPDELVIRSLKEQKHVLQLIMYAYLYKDKHGVIPESSIISFISGNNIPFVLDTKSCPLEEIIEDFPSYVEKILEEVYDPELPFKHNTKSFISYCQYCD